MPVVHHQLGRTPHLAVTPVVIRHDVGDFIAQKAGTPLVTTACGEDLVSTLTTRRLDLVRCPDCKEKAGNHDCPSCCRPDVVRPDGTVAPHDVLGLASPCDAPPSWPAARP